MSETQELTLHKVRPAMFRSRPFLFILSVLTIPLGIGMIILAIWFLKCYSTALIVTDRRTTLRYGILSKTTNEVRHKDVRNVIVHQSLFQRMFNTGTVGVSSAGQSEVEISVSGIPRPQKIIETIREYQA